MYGFLVNMFFCVLKWKVKSVCESKIMNSNTYFIDFLNVRYSYRKKSISSILRAFDKTLRENCRAYYYCIPFGKGYDHIEHINTFYLPEGKDDDELILQLCEKNKGFVISRDKFRNYPEYEKIAQKKRFHHLIRNGSLKLIHASRINDKQLNRSSLENNPIGRVLN